jgi:hypothetical protein
MHTPFRCLPSSYTITWCYTSFLIPCRRILGYPSKSMQSNMNVLEPKYVNPYRMLADKMQGRVILPPALLILAWTRHSCSRPPIPHRFIIIALPPCHFFHHMQHHTFAALATVISPGLPSRTAASQPSLPPNSPIQTAWSPGSSSSMPRNFRQALPSRPAAS